MSLLGVAMSAPSLVSLIQRQWSIPTAPGIHEVLAAYRALAQGAAQIVHAPLVWVSLPPPPQLIDLHILSFAGMGMMTRALSGSDQRRDAWQAWVWSIAAVVLGFLLVGVLVLAGILAGVIADPLKASRSDHWIETTPLLEGPIGRLARERSYRLERDLARIMIVTLAIVAGYFALNAALLN